MRFYCIFSFTDASVELLVSNDNVLQGIFFQDKEMQDIFSAYPELVCIDATYKLLELRFPVYVMLVEDGNGQSEIAAIFLLMEETESSISCMVNVFKKHNSNWESVRVLMADKDMTERTVFAAGFPQAELLICLYHTFRTFRREIVTDKMGITSGQRSSSLEVLQQLAYATSEESYGTIYKCFCETAPKSVVDYFNEQWHPIHRQWVMGMKYATGNFLNGTNNRLESVNQKLKSVIPRFSSLEDFISNFFLILRVMRSERDHKAALVVQKVPVAFHSSCSKASVNYMKYLTPYAYQLVEKQMSLKDKVKLKQSENSDNFLASSSEGDLSVTASSCMCMSWLSLRLPCRHIFAARGMLGFDLYDENLCDRRWSCTYYKSNQRIFLTDVEQSATAAVDVLELPPPVKRPLSQVC